jgi:hypothetical protein
MKFTRKQDEILYNAFYKEQYQPLIDNYVSDPLLRELLVKEWIFSYECHNKIAIIMPKVYDKILSQPDSEKRKLFGEIFKAATYESEGSHAWYESLSEITKISSHDFNIIRELIYEQNFSSDFLNKIDLFLDNHVSEKAGEKTFSNAAKNILISQIIEKLPSLDEKVLNNIVNVIFNVPERDNREMGY